VVLQRVEGDRELGAVTLEPVPLTGRVALIERPDGVLIPDVRAGGIWYFMR
jgi:hypothetical protein